MTSRRRPFRRRGWLAAAVAAGLALALVLLLRDQHPVRPTPATLLAQEPVLPATLPGHPQTIEWRLQPGWADAGAIDECPFGSGASHGWTDGGHWLAEPAAWESVCVYRFELAARLVYWRQSLLGLGGEDAQPNLDTSGPAEAALLPDAALGALHADASEIACGTGDVNGACSVWTFRARYGRVTFVTQVRTAGTRIPIAVIRQYVRSADRRIYERIRRGSN